MTEAVKQRSPGSLDWVRGEISARFGESAWVLELFVDRAIVEIGGLDGRLVEVDWTYTGDQLVVSEPREVTIEYVAKAEGGPRLTGPIVRKDAARQIAYAPVLVPGEPDADGEVLTAEKVEEVAHTWLETFRAIDKQHSVKAIDAAPVESYLEPQERTVTTPDGDEVTLPEGTWVMAARVRDEVAWKEIEDGKRGGFSVMGVPREVVASALASVKSGDRSALKRVTLADVGGGDANGDWVAPFVSIVDRPAVPKAKWIALKAQQAAPEEEPGWLRRLLGIREESAGKEGRRFSESTLKQLRAATEALQGLLEEAEKERQRAGQAQAGKEEPVDEAKVQELVTGAVKSALGSELRPALDAYVTELAQFATPPEGEKEPEGEKNEDLEALKSEIVTRLEKLEQKTGAASKQLPPEDGEGAEKSRPRLERDIFGRRVRRAS